jgi:hypothetical protein
LRGYIATINVIFYPENGVTKLLWNVVGFLLDYTYFTSQLTITFIWFSHLLPIEFRNSNLY